MDDLETRVESEYQTRIRSWDALRRKLAWCSAHNLVSATSDALAGLAWLNYRSGRHRVDSMWSDNSDIPMSYTMFHFDHTSYWRQIGTNTRVLVTQPYNITIPHDTDQVIPVGRGVRRYDYRFCWYARSWYYDTTTLITITMPHVIQRFPWDGTLVDSDDVSRLWRKHAKGNTRMEYEPRPPLSLNSYLDFARRRRLARKGMSS